MTTPMTVFAVQTRVDADGKAWYYDFWDCKERCEDDVDLYTNHLYAEYDGGSIPRRVRFHWPDARVVAFELVPEGTTAKLEALIAFYETMRRSALKYPGDYANDDKGEAWLVGLVGKIDAALAEQEGEVQP